MLEAQAGLSSRAFDRLAQLVAGERTHQVQPLLDETGECRVRAQLPEVVSPYARDDRCTIYGVVRQSPTEPCGHLVRSADGEQLLELVHHDHRCPGSRRERGRHRPVGVGARSEHRNGPPGGDQPRCDAGSHQRRLAATRRAGNHQDCGPLQAPQARRNLAVPPEERLGVTHVVGQESLVRAVPGHDGGLGGRRQLVVLTQDRRLQRHQLGPRFDAELFDERVPGPTQRS